MRVKIVYGFHKNTYVPLLQRTIQHPAGDASLPRSEPNISIPDKGELPLSAHNSTLLLPTHTHTHARGPTCNGFQYGWKFCFVKRSEDHLAWYDGSWQLNFHIQSPFLSAALTVTNLHKCLSAAVITVQIYGGIFNIFSHLSTFSLKPGFATI